MNNAKMWLVVSPSVGVPVFLGAVALGSFSVHVAVVSNTSWVSDFLSGQELGTGDAQAAADMLVPEMDTAKTAYVIDSPHAGQEVTIVMQDGTVARAVIQAEEVLASASADTLPLILDQ